MSSMPTEGLVPGGARGGDVDESGLITPEAVPLGLPIASVGSRAVGMLLDALLQGAALVVLAFAAGVASGFGLGGVGVAVLVVALTGVLLGYPIAFETLWRGRTPGKAVMGLRVVTVEAAPVGIRHATIRAALGLLDFWASSGGVAVLSALFTRRAQRLGDLAAGTLVIREGRGTRRVTAVTFTPPAGTEVYMSQLDVSGLDEADYGALRTVLMRARDLGEAAAAPLAARTLQVVAARVRPAPPATIPPVAALTCLAAAYQQRSASRPSSNAADWIWR